MKREGCGDHREEQLEHGVSVEAGGNKEGVGGLVRELVWAEDSDSGPLEVPGAELGLEWMRRHSDFSE